MRATSLRIGLLVVFSCLTIQPSAAFADHGSAVEAAVSEVMAKYEIPGVILGVWQRGEKPIVKAFGSRTVDVAKEEIGPPDMKTNLYVRLGSETKTFTATAVLQLVEEGKVGLEDPISKYVKGVPNGANITVRDLGEMRSGLFPYNGNPTWYGEFVADPLRTWAPPELLAASYSQPPTSPPGTAFEYSNTNYILLGLLVEAVSGERIGPYIERHILAPLHMEHTLFARGNEFPRPHPDGYTTQTPTGTLADATNWSPSWAWAAGAMISNLHDLRIWAKAVATGTLLSPAIQHQRERFLPIESLKPARYGFGLFDVDGWIGHDGEVPGYESLTVYLPAQQATVILLINSDIGAGEFSKYLGEAVTRVITPAHVYHFGGPPPAT